MAPASDPPGVHVEEVPSGRPPLQRAPTAVTAFVGPARRGPLDSPVEVRSLAEFTRRFGRRWRRSELAYAVEAFFDGGGARAVIVRVASADASTASLDVDGLRLAASSAGRWGNRITATVTHDAAGSEAAFILELKQGSQTETFTDLAVDDPRRIERALDASDLVRLDGALPTVRPAAGTYAVARADRGSHGAALVADDYIGTAPGAAPRGLHALDAAEDVDLICLPPPQRGGELPASVWPAAAAYARARGAMLLLDPPADVDAEDVAPWVAGVGVAADDASHVAAYFPRLRWPRGSRRDLLLAPSGAVAGVYARTDLESGVWKAPAGADATLADAVGLEHGLAEPDIALLSEAGINALRADAASPLVWGARTLAGSRGHPTSEWKYVPVRRLALHVERSLVRGLAWAVFEPNDEPLWAEVRAVVEQFLLELYRDGALLGSRPRDAWFVRCGRETMTQADLDRGVLRVQVGLAATRPAEFAILAIELTMSQA